jgi:hypothetical protein
MRGPLLSGPLGSASALHALARWTTDAERRGPLVVLGPLWLGDRLAAASPVLMLVEPQDRPSVLRTRRRAAKASRPLEIAMAAADLPLRPGSLGALVVENAAGLGLDEAVRWIGALAPCLRPGGRLIAADATSSKAAAARVAGVFLSAALIELVQEWPRDGVVLTVGVAPAAPVAAARFGSGGGASAASGSGAAPG